MSDVAEGIAKAEALRQAGFSEDEVAAWRGQAEQELKSAGFSPVEVVSYFGGPTRLEHQEPAQPKSLLQKLTAPQPEGEAYAKKLGYPSSQAMAQGYTEAMGTGPGMAIPAGIKKLADFLGKPARALADRAMQKAVGRTKYTPGVGEALAEEGIVGTRGMMKKQAQKALEKRGAEIGELVEDIPGQFASEGIAAPIYEEGLQYIPAKGAPSVADMPRIEKIAEFGKDIESRGAQNAQDLWERQKIAGKRPPERAWAPGVDEQSNLMAKLSKKEQKVSSDILKKAYAESHPQNPEQLSKTKEIYGALKRAEKPLSKEAPLPELSTAMLRYGIPGAAGYALGGPAVAALGAAARTPLGMSVLGQGLSKGAKIPRLLAEPVTRMAPPILHKDEKKK